VLLHVIDLLLKAAGHLVPNVDEAHFDDFELLLPRLQERLALAGVLQLQRSHLLFVALNKVFGAAEKFLPTFQVVLLSLDPLRCLYLLLQGLGVLVETALPQIVRPPLHLDHCA